MTAELARNIAIRGNKMSGRQNILDKPRVSVYHSAPQATVNAAATPALWDIIEYDTDGLWGGTPFRRITARTAGLYLFTTLITWDSNAAGYRQVFFQKNAGPIYGESVVAPVTGAVTCQGGTPSLITMNAGDFVEVVIVQTSGGALNSGGSTSAMFLNGFQACLIST